MIVSILVLFVVLIAMLVTLIPLFAFILIGLSIFNQLK
jgi:hypothetical protein